MSACASLTQETSASNWCYRSSFAGVCLGRHFRDIPLLSQMFPIDMQLLNCCHKCVPIDMQLLICRLMARQNVNVANNRKLRLCRSTCCWCIGVLASYVHRRSWEKRRSSAQPFLGVLLETRAHSTYVQPSCEKRERDRRPQRLLAKPLASGRTSRRSCLRPGLCCVVKSASPALWRCIERRWPKIPAMRNTISEVRGAF